MYERYGENDKIRIPVKLPKRCDPLQPIYQRSKGKSGEIENRMLDFDLDTIDITSNGLATRRGKFKDINDKDDGEDDHHHNEEAKEGVNGSKNT